MAINYRGTSVARNLGMVAPVRTFGSVTAGNVAVFADATGRRIKDGGTPVRQQDFAAVADLPEDPTLDEVISSLRSTLAVLKGAARIALAMLALGAGAQTSRLGSLRAGDVVVTNEQDALAYPIATNALALAEGALQPPATNGLPVAVAHAESAHGLTDNGGFAGGDGANATYGGGAVGHGATATYGGAVGAGATATYGGAVGDSATATYGGAVGSGASATYGGGAVGRNASATDGGAVGYGAVTSSGFAGGFQAMAALGDGTPIDAIQLGTGWNPDANTLQVYSYKLLNADGSIPAERMATTLSGYATTGAVAAVLALAEGALQADATNGLLRVESDPVAYPVATNALTTATNALALAEGALQPSATNGLASAVEHAQSAHGVTDNGGFAGGALARATYGGAVGAGAYATYGGAVGYGATAPNGGAVGRDAYVTYGGAVGRAAYATDGGAVGYRARTSSGFAGGYQAIAALDDTGFGQPIDAIQLGTGLNPDPSTLQVYSYKLLNADGSIPAERMATTLSGYATTGAVAAVSNWVESIRGVHADIATNVVYHVVVSNGHWLIQEVE